MTIDDFLASRYVEFGRAFPDLDCYGLVRLARKAMFGRDWMPEFADIKPTDKESLTVAAVDVRRDGGYQEVEPRPGAIATAWQASLCVHVGIVVEADGILWVLETEAATGPCLTRIGKFKPRYTKVVFYDN